MTQYLIIPRLHNPRTLALLGIFYFAAALSGIAAIILSAAIVRYVSAEITLENFLLYLLFFSLLAFAALASVWHFKVWPLIKLERERALKEFEASIGRKYQS